MAKGRTTTATLSEDDAVRLFAWRASDARGDRPLSRSELAIARRIVQSLDRNRLAILVVAGRCASESIEEVERGLATLDDLVAPDADLRAALSHGARLREEGKLAQAEARLRMAASTPKRDYVALADIHRLLGAVYRAQGRLNDALDARTRALELARAIGDAPRLACVIGEVGTALASLGRLRDARQAHEEALALHREHGSRKEEGVELSYLGVALHRAGLFEEAKRAHERALAIHLECNNRRLEGAERMHLGYVAHELGALDEARAAYREARRTLRRVRDRALEGVVLSYLGALEVEAKRPEEAGALLAQARIIHREAGSKRHEAVSSIHIAEHHLALGEERTAERILERALAGDVLEIEHRAWAEALLGRFPSEAAPRLEDRATAAGIELLSLAFALSSGRRRARETAKEAHAEWRRRSGASPPGSRVRFALRRIERLLADAAAPLRCQADGASVTLPNGRAIDLARRETLRLVLMRLVAEHRAQPGTTVPWERLLEAGWPGERVLHDAGFIRVRNVIAQLRSAGFADLLVTARGGYLLEPTVGVTIALA